MIEYLRLLRTSDLKVHIWKLSQAIKRRWRQQDLQGQIQVQQEVLKLLQHLDADTPTIHHFIKITERNEECAADLVRSYNCRAICLICPLMDLTLSQYAEKGWQSLANRPTPYLPRLGLLLHKYTVQVSDLFLVPLVQTVLIAGIPSCRSRPKVKLASPPIPIPFPILLPPFSPPVNARSTSDLRLFILLLLALPHGRTSASSLLLDPIKSAVTFCFVFLLSICHSWKAFISLLSSLSLYVIGRSLASRRSQEMFRNLFLRFAMRILSFSLLLHNSSFIAAL